MGKGQKLKCPPESVRASMKMRSVPDLSELSRATVAPAMGCEVTLSTTWPEIPVVFVLTTPAVRVGLSRNLPLPSSMIEAQALKSTLMSTDWPATTWMGPPTTCPGGIFRPVLAWLESWSSEVLLLLVTTQLNTWPRVAQAFGEVPALEPGLSETRRRRTCW